MIKTYTLKATSDIQNIAMNVLLLMIPIIPVATLLKLFICGSFSFLFTFLIIEVWKLVLIFGIFNYSKLYNRYDKW